MIAQLIMMGAISDRKNMNPRKNGKQQEII